MVGRPCRGGGTKRKVPGCCQDKLRGSPSLRSLAVITSGNEEIKLLNKVTLWGKARGGWGEHSLCAVCQPGTPRNPHLRPVEVKPLIRNNRASEKEGTIRETEVGVGERGKNVSFTL